MAGHLPQDQKRVFLPRARLGDREAEKRGLRASGDRERLNRAGVAVYHGVLDDYVLCRHRDSAELPVRFPKCLRETGGVDCGCLAVDEPGFLGKLDRPPGVVGVEAGVYARVSLPAVGQYGPSGRGAVPRAWRGGVGARGQGDVCMEFHETVVGRAHGGEKIGGLLEAVRAHKPGGYAL